MQGIFIALDRQERRLLVKKAKEELRTPDDQARSILRSVLLGEKITENKSVATSQGLCDAFGGTN